MSSFNQAQALFAQGREADAIALVERGAAAGDPELQFTLAHWRLFAMYGPRNLAEAHKLLKKAAQGGHVEAHRTRAILVTNGTGCKSDPELGSKLLRKIAAQDRYADLQLKFLAGMMPRQAAKQAPRQLLSSDPRIELIRGLLLPQECRYLTMLSEPTLQPSIVVDPATGNAIPHPVRTSYGTSFGPTQEDVVVHAINRRIADATGTRVICGEPLHMLRYTPGQEYKPHVDALPDVENQRVLTALLYLNDGYAGGETSFPNLGIRVRGGTGDVLVFHNLLPDRRSDPRTQHAGEPVTEGTKWLATRWVRERPYHPWD